MLRVLRRTLLVGGLLPAVAMVSDPTAEALERIVTELRATRE
jgi:hypothetical protein